MEQEPQYTIDGLPVVREEIKDSLVRDIISGQCNFEYLVKKVLAENPVIVQYAESKVSAMKKRGIPKEILGEIGFDILLTYEMVRRQAASNKLDNQLTK